MDQPTEIIYESSTQLAAAQLGVREYRAEYAGTIREFHVWLDPDSGGFSGTWRWGFRIDGVAQLAGGERVSTRFDARHGSNASLAIPIAFGQRVSVDLLQRGNGRLTQPIVFLFVTED